MASIINSDNGAVSGSAGLKQSADTTGNLVLQSNGTTVLTIDTNSNVTIAGNITITGNTTSTSTGAFQVPLGNTAQRPSSAANGMLRYSNTSNSFEGYAAGAWGAIGGGSGGGLTWANVQTANLTAVSGNAYPVNTTASAIWVTLPSSPSIGNTVQLLDYAGTFATNNCTVNPNGGKINGNTSNVTLTNNRTSVGLVYIDSTQGWVAYDGFSTTPIGPYSVDYLVIAGGGGGGAGYESGGGGAGGFLTSTLTLTPGTSYTITVGGGGAGYPAYSGGWQSTQAASGTNSAISPSVTALGGGGGSQASGGSGLAGGSGGGGARGGVGGAGTAGQGSPGGTSNSGAPNYGGGGGGGAGGTGGNGSTTNGGAGGNGLSSTLSGSATTYAGGGGGGVYANPGPGGTGGSGGTGGGGPGGANNNSAGTAAPSNSGSGGGGGGGTDTPSSGAQKGGNGGSGVVIVRYLGSQRGTGGTISSSGGYTIHTFTTSSTYVA